LSHAKGVGSCRLFSSSKRSFTFAPNPTFLEIAMNSTLDSAGDTIAIRPKESIDVSAGRFAPPSYKTGPDTIVLQPKGCLDYSKSFEFQKVLEESLELATDRVVIDLIRVDYIDPWGVAALVAAMQHAMALGRTISFQSMDLSTRAAVETEVVRQREINFGPWNDTFGVDFEHFLGNLAQSRSS
jgi:anti-anti-sigma factor